MAKILFEVDARGGASLFAKLAEQESPASHQLVGEWPIEEVLGAIPLYDLREQIKTIEGAGQLQR